MNLKTYQNKRNFRKTKEPRGKKQKARSQENVFIIQKHAASHLHYDFRLELAGVLVSWAIPKGPSLDPKVKRLAMHVEDHPLEYASFEGIIPKGQYGGGTVMLWDKGEWISDEENPIAAYKKGDLTFELNAEKLKGRWKLIRINKNDKTWLLIKIQDEHAKPLKQYDITEKKPNSVVSGRSLDEIAADTDSVLGKKKVNPKLHPLKFDLKPKAIFKTISPQLAVLVDRPPEGEDWLHEIKFDGYRLLAIKKNNKTKLLTRNNQDWTKIFPEIESAINQLPIKNIILDGEVVALDKKQHSNFQLLQNLIKTKKKNLFYYLFDVIYYDQYDLSHCPLIQRKEVLQDLIAHAEHKIIRFSDHMISHGNQFFHQACKHGLEGIISKRIDSPYIQSRHSNWLKSKCLQRQEFIIVGFTKPQGLRQYFGALLLAAYNKQNELVYHGRVGTGFTESSLKSIYQELIKYKTDKSPLAYFPFNIKNLIWLKPVLVAEVQFIAWTKNEILRQPSFKGLRFDKPAQSISKEQENILDRVIKQNHKDIKENYKLTNPDKILYPEDKITKKELFDYYYSIQSWILPYIKDRPLTLLRCPKTVQKCFYQKHFYELDSPVLHEIKIKKSKESYLYIKDTAGLMALSQMNVLEIHPWGSTIHAVEHPDVMIFDIDPAQGLTWKKVVQAAFDIKKELDQLKLRSFVKMTGGKGLHVVVPILPQYSWQEIKKISHTIVKFLVMKNPKQYIATMTKSERKNKIYIDYLRNQRGATAIAPYSTRANTHAAVALPLSWDELTNDKRDTFFTIKTLKNRLESLKNDPWEDFFKLKQKFIFD